MTLTLTAPPATQGVPGLLRWKTYNPADYGNWDPSDVVGSNAALNAAITAAGKNGRGEIDLGMGTFAMASYIDQTVYEYVRLQGHGKGKTVLKLVNSLVYNFGILISSPFLHGNDLLDFTLDCNGAGGSVIGSQKAIIQPSSRCKIDIELCNWAGTIGTGTGANISGTTGIFVAGHDVDLSGTYVHDTYRWQIQTTAVIGAVGATTAAVTSAAGLSYVGGANGNQTLVIDPSVNAVLQVGVSAGAGVTAIPITDNDNPRPGAGLTTGMTGIYVGQQLVIDTAASGVQETVTVTAVTASSFQATFANAHAAGAPISYAGATETVQLGGVGGNTITFLTATQLGHTNDGVHGVTQPGTPGAQAAGCVAIIAYAQTYDAIAVAAWTEGNLYAEDIKYLHGKAERTGEDPIGVAVGRRITIADLHCIDCASGIALTDHVSANIHDCIINNSFNGQFPTSITPPGQIWSGVYVIGGAPPSSAGTQPSSWDGLRIHDVEINGYARGVVVSGASTNPIRDVDIHHCRLNGQGVEAIYISGAKQVGADHNKIRNANSYGLANAEGGLSVAGIFVAGTAAAPIDDVLLDANDIVDDRGGGAHMQAGIQLYGASSSANANNVRIRGGRIGGTTGTAIQAASMAAGTWVAREVLGYTPRAGAVSGAPTTTPASGTKYQNTTNADLLVSITGGTVSNITVYDSNQANGVSIATATNEAFVLPVGAYYSVTWTVQPTAGFYGL